MKVLLIVNTDGALYVFRKPIISKPDRPKEINSVINFIVKNIARRYGYNFNC